MSKGSRKRREDLRRKAARVDDVSLDTLWVMALRGDTEEVLKRLEGTKTAGPPKEKISWHSSSWIFGRKSYKRKR